LQTWCRLR